MIRLLIRRPVAVSMAYLAVAVLGVAAWRNIPIELLPDTTLPQLTVYADWPGASPEVTEAFLTSPLEAAIQQVRGVKEISSSSSNRNGMGRAEITVKFNRNIDMNFARLELSENLIVLDDELPEGATVPRVEPYVPTEFRDQDREFLAYTVTGPYTLEALREHIDEVIVPALLQVQGVANVTARGGRRRVLEVELDQNQLAALGLDINQIRSQINQLEYVSEAGLINDAGTLRTLAIRQRVGSADDVRKMVVSGVGRLIRLEDIAIIRDTYEEPRSFYRIDGLPAVNFEVEREAGVNVVAVSERVRARIDLLEAVHPPGVRLILGNDEAREIKKQLTDLRTRAQIAALVVFLVLLISLRSFRSAGIVFATIAFSILITLNLIYFGGMTLNVLTLMGLAMGFGLIVDNAIVVLENIHRRRNGGESPETASEKGALEVALPILAATLTTLIVFIPFVFLRGDLRVFYVPLAIVVGMSLFASLFVAFTFIPTLASKILKPRSVGAENESTRRPGYVRFYAGLVVFTTRHPWATVALAVLCFGGSGYLFEKHVTRGVLWGGFGQSTYIVIQINQPAGAELEQTDALVRFFEEKLATVTEIEQFTSQVFPQFAAIMVTFPDSIENTMVPPAVKEQLLAYSHSFGGTQVRVYGYGPSFYGGGGSAPNYSIQVRGYNYETTRKIARDLKQRLERFSRVRDVNTNGGGHWWQNERAVEYAVVMDRARLAKYDLTSRDVVQQVQASVRGRDGQGRLRVGGDELLFDVKFEGHRQMSVLELGELLLRTGGGFRNVRLANVASIEQTEVLNQIDRVNQQYMRFVRYEFRGPAKLGDRVRDAVIAATLLPDGYEILGTQEWSWGEGEQKQIWRLLGISLVLIFMVTAALFESIRLPFVVLLTVPMALIGVFLTFFFTDATFTREAWIGVIMMGGIVVNNAILLVDHINQQRRAPGVALRDAIVAGTLERVRPILMTSATTVFGLLPLVILSETADANIWNALGYALIGGLTASTFLVLTVTPALYMLSEARHERRKIATAAVRLESVPA